jgi:hypothetical protein
MSSQADLTDLKQQHRALEREIADAAAHLGADDLKLAELKRRKLHLKDEITRLSQETIQETVH